MKRQKFVTNDLHDMFVQRIYMLFICYLLMNNIVSIVMLFPTCMVCTILCLFFDLNTVIHQGKAFTA